MKNNVIELKEYIFKTEDLYKKHSENLNKIYWRTKQYEDTQARRLEKKLKRNKNIETKIS